MGKWPEADPFRIAGHGDAALLVHGLTGSPAQLRKIGDEISRAFGWEVRAPLLPGHGTTIRDLSNQTLENWLYAVDSAVRELAAGFARIHLLGLSMGASLCLETFRSRPEKISSLVLLAPALWLRSRSTTLLAHVLSSLPLPERLTVWPKSGSEPPGYVGYDSISIPAVGQFLRLGRRVRSLPRIETVPGLVIFSRSDETAHPRSGEFLARRLTHPQSRTVRLEKAGHVLPLTQEKERVVSEVLSFYRGITSPS
jgi:carboxylesterase